MNFWLKRGENDQWELLPAEGTELIAGHYAVITRSPQPHFTLTIDMIRYALDDPSPEASPSEPSGLSLLWSTRLGTKGRGKDWVELERQQRFIRTNDEGIGVILAPSHLSAGYWEFRCHDADLIAELFGEAQANVLHLKVVPDPTKTPAAEVSTPSATSSDLKGIPTEPSHALVDPEISSSHPLTTLHHEVPIQADVAPGSGGLTESIAPSESMGTAGSTRLRDSIGIPPSVEINQLGEPSGMSGSLEPSEPSESFDRSSRSLESPEGMGSSRSHESSDAFGSTRLTGSPPPTHASDPKRFRGITDPTTGSDPSPSYPATHVPDPFAVSGSHLTSGAEPKSEERSGSRVSSKLPMDPSLPALSSSDPSTAWQPDFSLMHHDIQGTPGEVLTLTGRIGCSGELEAELYAEDQLIFQQQRLIHLMPDAQSAVFSISLPLPPTPWSGPLTGVLTLNQTGLSDPPPRIDFSIRCRDPQTPPPILSYRSKGPESWNRWRSPQAPPPSFESPAIPLAPPEPSIPSTEVGILASPSADNPSSQ